MLASAHLCDRKYITVNAPPTADAQKHSTARETLFVGKERKVWGKSRWNDWTVSLDGSTPQHSQPCGSTWHARHDMLGMVHETVC